jgi:hypothetical protein
VEGVADIVKFARSVNPEDQWNMDHPAEYAAGLSGTLAGLAEDEVNPENAVKGLLGGGWGSDPFAAVGRLVPNDALAVGTDGAGAAADAGADAALGAGEDAAAETSGAMFSSGSAVSNADVVSSGVGLARTSATVSDVAARAGVDLGNTAVKIIEDPEYLRYLDSQAACACAPYDLPGEIHLGPASFIDEDTLAATLAHEMQHVAQYAAGYVPGSGDLEEMEAAARAAEGPALAQLLGVEP